MKQKELKELVASLPPEDDELEVKIWLPGSRIALSGPKTFKHGGALMIEGNLEEGSALA